MNEADAIEGKWVKSLAPLCQSKAKLSLCSQLSGWLSLGLQPLFYGILQYQSMELSAQIEKHKIAFITRAKRDPDLLSE